MQVSRTSHGLRALCVIALIFIAVHIGMAQPSATTTTLSLSSSSVAPDTAVTLTATVSSTTAGTITGQVLFCNASAKYCEGPAIVGTAWLITSGTTAGTATVHKSFGPGTYSIEAIFQGTNSYSTSTSSASSLTVSSGPLPTTTTIGATGTSGSYTLSGTVFAGGTVAPTGSVAFLDATSNTQLASVLLSSGTETTGFLFADIAGPATTSNNQAIAVGDFNNDGKLDYVVANLNASSVATIMLGNGNGTFTSQPTTYSAGSAPEAAVVADFNGDGNLDIAFADLASSGVTILLGNGDGTFTSPAAQPALGFGSAIAVGDFNGDGIPDLAVSNNNGSTYAVTILLGNGDGTFTVGSSTTIPSWSMNPEGIVAMDFNGDGKLDLAVTSANASSSPASYVITILLGNGNGTFTVGNIYTTGNGDQSMVGGDFNGDGIPDLAMANYDDDTVTILLGNGDGTFTAPSGPLPATGIGPFAIVSGDFNNDGTLDLATANYTANTVTFLLGNGDGTFTAATTTPATGTGPDGIAVGDFNGDGLLDVVTANFQVPTNSVLLQATSSTAVAASGLAVPGTDSVYAQYGGDTNFSSSQSSTVPLNSILTQTINFPNPGPQTYGTSLTLSATATSGLPVSFAVTAGAATLSGNTLTFTGTGSVTVQATQNGNSIYPPAPAVNVTFAVNPASQTITFPNPGPVGTSTPPIALTATASSGLPVTYTLISGPGTLSGSTLTVTGVGNIVVEADQAGNSDYLPAPSVQITIEVVQGTYDTVALSLSSSSVAPDTPVTLTAAVTSSSSGTVTGQVLFCNASAARCEGPALLGSAWVMTSGSAVGTATIHRTFGPGTYSIEAVYQGTNTYAASTSAIATLTVSSGPLPTTTTIGATGMSGNYTLTGDIFAAGSVAPTGSAAFFDVTSNTQLASVALSSGTETTGFLFADIPSPAATINNQVIAVADFNNDGNLDYVVADQGASATATVMLGNGKGSFTAETTTYSVGSSPEGVVVSDFNGDGKLDIAFADASTNGVTILLGNGDGTFTTPASQPTISNAAAIAIGDFNGDGIPDLAVSNNGSSVTILLGVGDGTFTVGPSTTVPSWSIYPEGIVAMDFNGDGKLDLAVTSANASSTPASYVVTILLGNGDGTFTLGTSYPTGNGDQSMAGGDFNNDGKPDLAIANYNDNTVTILLGNGDGTFTAATGSPVATGTGPVAIVAGDFNNDGKLDLATANYSANTVTFLLGNGDGTFVASATTPGTGSGPDGLAAGDFNGDGLLDIVTANNQTTTESILLGATSSTVVTATGLTIPETDSINATYSGNTNFISSQSLTAPLDSLLPGQTINFPNPGPQTYGTPLTLTATATSGLPVSFAVISGPATLSGNTLTFTGVGPVTVEATQNGGGTYAPAPPVDQTFTVNAASQTITFPNPGPQTYGTTLTLTATASSGLSVSFAVISGPATLSGSTLTFTGVGPVTVEATQAGNSTYAPAPPVDQTFTVSQASQTITFPNPGPLANTTPPVTLMATASSGLPVTYTLISGPGTLSGSVLTVTGVGSIIVQADQAGNADYLPAPSVQITILVVKPLPTTTTINASGTSGNYTLIATVWAGGTVPPTGNVSFFDATSNTQLATVPLSSGTVTTGFLFASTSGPATNSQKNQPIAVADFNKDGNLDYVVANVINNQGGPSTATIMLGNGEGGFTAQPTTPSAGNSPEAVVVADFNGDGNPDIAFSNSAPNGVTVLLGNGDGTFTSPASQPALAYGSAIAVGDFNGDGIPDLAVSTNNNSNYNVTILLGNGDGTFTAVPNPTSLPSWSINPEGIVAMDFNGDGKLDLAVTSANTNSPASYQVTILLGNGDGTFKPGATYTTGNGDQSMVGGDFNGDGIPDLAIANYYDNTVTVLLGNGDGTFAPATGSPVPTGSGPFAIVAADFNGDHKLDLATADYSANTVTFLLGNGDGTFTAASSTPSTGGGPDGIAVGDFNGDGLPDVVTANFNSTTQSVLLQATSETTVTATGLNIPGTDNVYAAYSGDNIFLPSQSPTVPVSSVLIVPAAQTVTFPNPGTVPSSGQVPLTATASSGLPVTYTLISGPGTISGSTLTVTGAGSIVVEADQAGDGFYAAAPSVQITITAVAAQFTLSPNQPTGGTTITAGETVSIPVTVYAASGFTGTMSFTCTTPTAMLGASCSAASVQITNNKPVTASVIVDTTASTQSASLSGPKPLYWTPLGVGFAAIVVASGMGKRRRTWKKALPLAALLVIGLALLPSCGGNAGNSTTGTGTPAGNYTLTLVGTSGGSSYTASLPVTVK